MIPLDSPADYVLCAIAWRLTKRLWQLYNFFFIKINVFPEKKEYSRLSALAIFKKQPAEWACPDMELVNSSESREQLAI